MATINFKRLNFTVVVIVVLILLASGMFLFYKDLALKSPSNKAQFQACPKSGFLTKQEYLETYTVKKGDSLLSVAKNVLNDASRVEELIKLNNDSYPRLSLENSFLEQGWKLTLPPQNLGKTNGIILVAAGRVSISDVGWGINWANSGIGPFELSELPESISEGNCVVVIYQGNDVKSPSVLRVSSVIKQE